MTAPDYRRIAELEADLGMRPKCIVTDVVGTDGGVLVGYPDRRGWIFWAYENGTQPLKFSEELT